MQINKAKETAVQILRQLWQNKYRLFYCMVMLCLLFGTYNYFRSGSYASANISFNYSEASQGLSPNKTRFNAYEIVSDEVLRRAIERVGLQDHITSTELAQCVSVSPDGTGNVSGSDDYISTAYNISLNTSTLDLGNRKPMDLLRSICASYREVFLENYCDDQSILLDELEITEESEPYLRLNELQLRAEQITRYLNARLKENKSFVDSGNDDSATNNFTNLGKKISNIVDYDIPNVMAFVVEGGIARDPQTLTDILEYKNKIDDISLQKYMVYYDANKNGISLYEKSMTSVVMIPTVDELSEYYMSRTKTAMDTMARAADTALSEATDYQSEIVNTSYVIQKIRDCTTDQQRLAEAQQMINRLEQATSTWVLP